MSFASHHPRPGHDRFSRGLSYLMYGLCVAATLAILATLAMVTIYLIAAGLEQLSLTYFTHDPINNPANPAYPGGFRQAILGSAILVGLAAAVGLPIGILAGVYLSEYESGSFLAAPVRFISDVLAGVPSIVVGILGYELLVAPAASGAFKHIPLLSDIQGFNGYAGAAALAFILIPIVARTTEEMLRLVPHSYREASIALGATKATTILRVVLPSATGSVITGIMLGIARITGETAPLLLTALGASTLTTDPSKPFPSLTVQAFDFAFRRVQEAEQDLAKTGILVLIALVFVLNLTLRLIAMRHQRS